MKNISLILTMVLLYGCFSIKNQNSTKNINIDEIITANEYRKTKGNLMKNIKTSSIYGYFL